MKTIEKIMDGLIDHSGIYDSEDVIRTLQERDKEWQELVSKNLGILSVALLTDSRYSKKIKNTRDTASPAISTSQGHIRWGKSLDDHWKEIL